MSTAITLAGERLDDELADRFFARIAELEDLLSRFRPESEISRFARGALAYDALRPEVREVLTRCDALHDLTRGAFEHRPGDPPLDVDGLAKGWIVEEAAAVLRLAGASFFVNAGGDITTSRRADGTPWRVGIQHPHEPDAVLGVIEVDHGAVATSGTYERGEHIRGDDPGALRSATVVGPELGETDGLATAVFASGHHPPAWWADVPPTYGLLTLSRDGARRWLPPAEGDAFRLD